MIAAATGASISQTLFEETEQLIDTEKLIVAGRDYGAATAAAVAAIDSRVKAVLQIDPYSNETYYSSIQDGSLTLEVPQMTSFSEEYYNNTEPLYGNVTNMGTYYEQLALNSSDRKEAIVLNNMSHMELSDLCISEDPLFYLLAFGSFPSDNTFNRYLVSAKAHISFLYRAGLHNDTYSL